MRLRRDRDRTREEFERFVAASAPGLIRTAFLVVWELPAAEDLVQECLTRVAHRWPRVRTMAHPAAYARRVLLNLALDEGARRSRTWGELSHVEDVAAAADAGTPDAFARVDDRTDLLHALGRLARGQRAVLVLRYLEDQSESQVAELLGCSVGTVKSTASRGLARLRELSGADVANSGGADLVEVHRQSRQEGEA